ncbi:hypothetical protein FIBSPDRAFT_743180 [Athelia psychrophila]|uniref:Uncharacterized protein n=1 Tax=Athelia psychrophila TaxID=1759441 RepID=A0A166IGU6_9AGAM|nr:hypothetical protein FIBSPDRAFT_743180 [Fibularhizoctonia sp. CBS 109695]
MSLRGASASVEDLLENNLGSKHIPEQPIREEPQQQQQQQPEQAQHADQPHTHTRSRKMKQVPASAPPAPVELTPAQELAAITSFLASLPENVIPPSVDPSAPIDPALVLDFDMRSASAKTAQAVAEMVQDAWARNPVVLYARVHSAGARAVKALLADLHLAPPPTVFNVDTRTDAAVLTGLITRLAWPASASAQPRDLPVLLVGGKPVGTVGQIEALAKDGGLARLITEAGGVIGGGKKMKKGRK